MAVYGSHYFDSDDSQNQHECQRNSHLHNLQMLLTISVMNVMVDLGQNMLRPKCSKFDYLYGGCALFGDFSHLATYISIVRG